MDLKVRIQKDQIMNYELSSKTLRDKIRQVYQDKDNFEEEMRLNVIESNILNAGIEEWTPNLNASEELGFSLLNMVRALTFKPPIRMINDRNTLINIQYAFYQERKRKFAIAHEYYNSLENTLSHNTEERAFVLLHNGFCLAMMGKDEESIEKLEVILNNYAGSHYSDNAIFFKRLILESKNKKNSIAKKNLSFLEKIEYYYKNGNYEDVVLISNKKENLIPKHQYMVSRSNEETGRIQEAIRSYIRLTTQNQDPKVAIQANRRLLLLGNFYTQQDDLVKFSKIKSEELGDKDSYKLLEEGSRIMKSPKIILVIEKDSAWEKNPESESNLKINKEIEEIVDQELSRKLIDKKNLKILIELKDGRKILSKAIEFQDDFLMIEMNAFPMRTPISNFKSIQLYNDKLKREADGKFKIKSSNGVLSVNKLTQTNGRLEIFYDSVSEIINHKSIIKITL